MRLAKCCKCSDKIAVWFYMPDSSDEDRAYCDDCVSRGCSCNILPGNTEEERDEQGRLMPCCEYAYKENGHDLDEPPLTEEQIKKLEDLWAEWSSGKITAEEYEKKHRDIFDS